MAFVRPTAEDKKAHTGAKRRTNGITQGGGNPGKPPRYVYESMEMELDTDMVF